MFFLPLVPALRLVDGMQEIEGPECSNAFGLQDFHCHSRGRDCIVPNWDFTVSFRETVLCGVVAGFFVNEV